MRTFIAASSIILCAFLSAAAVAEPPPSECFQNENDPQTKRPYQNREQWEADRDALRAKTPSLPGIMSLWEGYNLASAEGQEARKTGSDKRRHCYLGCRLAKEVSHEVAVYAGYYKEDKDLRDCNGKTQFDLKDIDATVSGADIALQNPAAADKEYCKKQCQQKFR